MQPNQSVYMDVIFMLPFCVLGIEALLCPAFLGLRDAEWKRPSAFHVVHGCGKPAASEGHVLKLGKKRRKKNGFPSVLQTGRNSSTGAAAVMTQQSEASLCLHANAGRFCGSAWVLFVCVCVPMFLCGRAHNTLTLLR